MVALVVALFHVLGVVSSIHAIMTTRTEQGTIAWAVSLNTFPYLAVPAYWVLGRSRFEGYVAARRENLEAVTGVTKEAVAAISPYRVPAGEVARAVPASERLAGIPFLRGNSVELLVNGEATFRSPFEGIETAREHLLVEFYICALVPYFLVRGPITRISRLLHRKWSGPAEKSKAGTSPPAKAAPRAHGMKDTSHE